MRSFGRIIPIDWSHVLSYPYREVATIRVEKRLTLPDLVTFYDQKANNACVGFASSWMMSMLNSPDIYDALWLWQEAKKYDNIYFTKAGDINGTTVNGAMTVLRKFGHKEVVGGIVRPTDINNGIREYRWATKIDEIRNAIYRNIPVVLGINWYSSFDVPIMKGTDMWIGEGSNWGFIEGGHSICLYGALDSKQAFCLVNTWGYGYPKILLPYTGLQRLLKEDGEAAIVVDRPTR